MREVGLRNRSTHQWEVDLRLFTWTIGDFGERHITEPRNTGPVRKKLLEKEVGWHWTDDTQLNVACETLSLVAGLIR